MEDCELVLLERLTGGIAQITLNSPPLNLITTQMNRRLDAILDEVKYSLQGTTQGNGVTV